MNNISAKDDKLYKFGKHDAQSAEKYWNHFKKLSFGEKLKEYYHMGMAIVDCVSTWKQKQKLLCQATVDVKQYEYDVKSGNVQGKESVLQKEDVFALYAEAINGVECWIGYALHAPSRSTESLGI